MYAIYLNYIEFHTHTSTGSSPHHYCSLFPPSPVLVYNVCFPRVLHLVYELTLSDYAPSALGHPLSHFCSVPTPSVLLTIPFFLIYPLSLAFLVFYFSDCSFSVPISGCLPLLYDVGVLWASMKPPFHFLLYIYFLYDLINAPLFDFHLQNRTSYKLRLEIKISPDCQTT